MDKKAPGAVPVPVSSIFSPDSTRMVYLAQTDKQLLVVVDEKEGKSYDGISKGFPIFSPDSMHVAYVAWVGEKRTVVVDGKEEKPYDDVGHLIFSPDSKRVAYPAKLGNKWFVVEDGNEKKPYEYMGVLIFSPDSKRVAYPAKAGNKWLMVVDETEEKPYDNVGDLIFSPDSKRVAYAATVDAVIFDSKTMTFGAGVGNKQLVIVDGKEQKVYDAIITAGGGKILFDSPDSFHYMAGDRNIIYLVEETLKQ